MAARDGYPRTRVTALPVWWHPLYALPMNKPVKIDPGERGADFEKAVREGIADADAGRTVPYEKIRRWLLSWGTDKELPPPK